MNSCNESDGERSAESEFEQIQCVLAQQRHEPQGVGTRSVDHQIEAVHRLEILPALIRAQRQADSAVSRHRVCDPAPQVADPVVGQQRILYPRREHPAVRPGQRVSPFLQCETGPAGGVGEQRVLEETLAAGEQGDLG